MAELRTDAQRRTIAFECAKIEQAGGDVLAHLRELGYLSPWGTWYRMQREFLHRKKNTEITDGKPKRKETVAMEWTKEERALHMEAFRANLHAGEDVRTALELTGLEGRSLGQTYRQMRAVLLKTDPAFAAKLPERIPAAHARKVYVQMDQETDEDEDGMDEEDEPESKGGVTVAGESITVAGEKKELRLEQGVDYMVKVKAGPENAPEAGIRKPLMHSGMEACAWRGKLGEFRYDIKHGYIDYDGKDAESLSMTLEDWREFLQELKTAAALMGVEL